MMQGGVRRIGFIRIVAACLLVASATAAAQVDMNNHENRNAPWLGLSFFESLIFDIGHAHLFNSSCDDATDRYCLSDGVGLAVGIQPSDRFRLVPRISYWSSRGVHTGISLAYYTAADSGSAFAVEPELGFGLDQFTMFGRLTVLTSKLAGKGVYITGGVRLVM